MESRPGIGKQLPCGGCFFLRGGMGNFTEKEPLLAGFCKISSEVQKSSCIVHRCTVYDLIVKNEVGCKWPLR